MAPTITVSKTGKLAVLSEIRYARGSISFPEPEAETPYEYAVGGEAATLAQLSGGKINELWQATFEPWIITEVSPHPRFHAQLNAALTKLLIFHSPSRLRIRDNNAASVAIAYNLAAGELYADFGGAGSAGDKTVQAGETWSEGELADTTDITGVTFNYLLLGRYVPA